MDTPRKCMLKPMQSAVTNEEKLRYLRKQRKRLLEDIHSKQKFLDQLDYLIFTEEKP